MSYPLSLLHSCSARLGPRETRRRFCHILPGLLPFLLVALVRHVKISVPVRIAIGLILAVWFAAYLLRQTAAIRRRGERSLAPNVFGYVVPILATFLLFPAHLEIAFTTWVVLAFGDGTATVGGILAPPVPLPWNRAKSWAGLLCFVYFGGLFCALLYREAMRTSWNIAFAYGFGISLPCAVVESLPSRGNDNPRVGIAASLGAMLIHFLRS